MGKKDHHPGIDSQKHLLTSHSSERHRYARISWALYDWANSSFAAIISTFVFPAYFIREVAVDETLGTTQWGNTVGIAGLTVAIFAPVLGAIADQGGHRKRWIGVFTILCVLATGALWWVQPLEETIFLAMYMVGFAIIAAEFAGMFYNAMLPSLVSFERLGRWSGWAWGLGYAGGIACLIFALFGFVQEEAWFNLSRADFEHVRATFILVAVWYTVFALPLFVFTPDEPAPQKGFFQAIRDGLNQFRDSIHKVRSYASILRFLLARMIYTDSLVTIFAFGGVFAAGTFGMNAQEVLMFGIALHVTAGLGAAAFAWMDDWFGSKQTIMISLVGLIVSGTILLVVESRTWFWVMGMLLGVFVGPIQAASRSYLARAAPKHLRSQMFGLFAFSGKATAFVGPLLVGWITGWFGNQRIGMSVIIILLLIGFTIMLTVPEAERKNSRSGSIK